MPDELKPQQAIAKLNEALSALDETYGFASTTKAAQDNINFVSEAIEAAIGTLSRAPVEVTDAECRALCRHMVATKQWGDPASMPPTGGLRLAEEQRAKARAALIAVLTPAPSVAESIAEMVKAVGGTVAHINDEHHPKPPWKTDHIPDAGKMVESCTWKEDEDGIYDGTCGVRWYFDNGDVKENGCNFCPKCGKPVRVALTPGEGGEVGP